MMKKLLRKSVLCLSLPFMLSAGTAEAEMVRVDFSGTIGILNDSFGDLAASGIESWLTPFSGSLVYDTASPLWKSQPGFTQYWAKSYSVGIGDGFSWSSQGSGNGIVMQDNRTVGTDTYDMFEADQGGYASVNGKEIWMDALVWMRDNSLLSFGSTELPTAEGLGGFNIDETFFRIAGYYGEGERPWDMVAVSGVEFSVSREEENSASVPEPSTMALLGCVLTGMLAVRRLETKA